MEGCPFVAKGENLETAMMQLKEHGMSVHGPEMQKMMAEGMTEAMMMDKMKSIAKTE